MVEQRAAEPIIPLRLFRDRTVTLSTVASLFVGIALFGGTVFLSQYFQISRAARARPMSGLMSLPLVLGLLAHLHGRRPADQPDRRAGSATSSPAACCCRPASG